MRNPSSGDRSNVFERQPPAASVIVHALSESAQRVFWLDELGRGPQYPSLDGVHTADLVVVGGGYTGCECAGDDGEVHVDFVIETVDLRHLIRLQSNLKKVPGVRDVHRVQKV